MSVSPPNVNHIGNIDSAIGRDFAIHLKLAHQRVPAAVHSATTTPRCNNPRPLSDFEHRPACRLKELPKYQPLRTVASDCRPAASCVQTVKQTASVDSIDSGFMTSDSPALFREHKTAERLDTVLQLFDRSVVLVWLEQTKRSVTDISDWCAEEENFVRFAHFWLSEFPPARRCSMFEFEYGLLREKIAASCGSKQPPAEDIASSLSAILHEFPEGRLNGLADAYVFLEHLEALAERRKRNSLLAAGTYSLHSRQHYGCLLAVRSYAIVSIWSAILDKYRSGLESVMASSKQKSARASTARVRSVRPSSASSQSTASRPSTANTRSRSDLRCFEDEVTAADADFSSQKRIYDAIKLVKFRFCFI